MHEFTDGCSAQYKSLNCMGDVCTHRSDLGYDVLIRNYFETSHGKGPHDAAGGFLKNQADYAVLRGKTKIQTARDLYDFAQENLQNPQSGIYKKRLFKYIAEIPRLHNINFKPVDQNRKIHQIISTNFYTDLLVRDLSCYNCDNCFNGAINECEKTQFIGNSKRVKMIQNDNSNSEKNDDHCNTNDNIIEDIVEKDMIIAVLADDIDYEYYLLRVSKRPQIIKKNISDDWGCSFNRGSKVVKRLYYERIKNQPFIFKLVKRKTAICYSSAIRFICVELESDSKIVVPEELHLDIIQSL
ncbi:unnamed protein product [Mytilus coruscus]|uniref:Uncharacterized protein n=1 Tax=Mytilus coruscus TaxID=42192 RepID=A0A6J8EGD8_MYTCO|nr:unnamed protein product [Mytilus coruscus]